MDNNLILIVDDEEDTRRLLKFALIKSGYIVKEAASGYAALELLKECKPDIIICDMVMPDMDGYEFMKQIKNVPDLSGIPIIVSTGKSGMKNYFDLEDKMFRPAAFLSKPYKMDLLIETVRRIWNHEVK